MGRKGWSPRHRTTRQDALATDGRAPENESCNLRIDSREALLPEITGELDKECLPMLDWSVSVLSL